MTSPGLVGRDLEIGGELRDEFARRDLDLGADLDLDGTLVGRLHQRVDDCYCTVRAWRADHRNDSNLAKR